MSLSRTPGNLGETRTAHRGVAPQSTLQDAILRTYYEMGEVEATKLLEKAELPTVISPQIRDIIQESAAAVLNGIVTGQLERNSVRRLIRVQISELLTQQGIIKHRSLNIQRIDSGNEQNTRCHLLKSAIEHAKTSGPLRDAVKELTQATLSSKFPPEVFHSKNYTENGDFIGNQQMCDFADNFLMWAIQNGQEEGRQLFSDDHLLVAYFYIFMGLNSQEIEMKLRGFENRDFPKGEGSHGITAERAEELYAEVQAAMSEKMDELLKAFLEEISLIDTRDSKIMPDLKKLTAARRECVFGKNRANGRSLVRALNDAEKSQTEYAHTQYDKSIEEVDVILAQRGNISARNRVVSRLLRLIGKYAHDSYAQYMMKRYGNESHDDFDELEGRLREVFLTKIAGCDPRKSRITSYLINWGRPTVDRFIYEEEVVRKPTHIHDARRYIERYRKHPVREICESEGLCREVVEAIVSKDPTEEQRALVAEAKLEDEKTERIRLRYYGLPLEAISKKYGISMVVLKRIQSEDHTRDGKAISVHTPVGEDKKSELEGYLPEWRNSIAAGGERDKRRQLIERALSVLPGGDADFLRKRFLDGMTLEALGAERGVTRARAEQIEKKIAGEIREAARELEKKKKGKVIRPREVASVAIRDFHFVVVRDDERFEKWLSSQEGLPEQAGEWFKASLGLNLEAGHKRLKIDGIKSFFDKKTGQKTSLREVKKALESLQGRLDRAQMKEGFDPFIIGVGKEEALHEASKFFVDADANVFASS